VSQVWYVTHVCEDSIKARLKEESRRTGFVTSKQNDVRKDPFVNGLLEASFELGSHDGGLLGLLASGFLWLCGKGLVK
jgi:hypothetical protein